MAWGFKVIFQLGWDLSIGIEGLWKVKLQISSTPKKDNKINSFQLVTPIPTYFFVLLILFI